MTDLGGAQAGERAVAAARPAPVARPAPQPVGHGTGTAGGAYVSADAQAAARAAATAALSAARAAAPRPPRPLAAPAQPWHPVATTPAPVRRPAVRPRRGIGVLQIVCWQLVLLAAILVVGRPWPTVVAAGLGALAVLALTAVRSNGRWGYEWLFLWWGYLMRDRDRELADAGGPGRALLRMLAPEAAGLADSLGDEPVFLVSHRTGITAVLQPKSVTQDPAGIPGPAMVLPPSQDQGPAFAAQVTYHAGMDRRQPPRIWLAVQALRTVGVYRDADVQQALANTLRRVHRRLRRGGLPTTALAESEFLGTLTSLAHVTAGRSRVREQWRHWYSGTIPQATFRLDGWAALSPGTTPQVLRGLLTTTQQTAVTVSVTATGAPSTTEPRIDAALRIAAATPAVVEHAAQTLTLLAAEQGIRLERLDGRHLRGLAATLPIGVTVS